MTIKTFFFNLVVLVLIAVGAQGQSSMVATTTEVVAGDVIVRIKGHIKGDATKRVFAHIKGRAHLNKSVASLNIHHLTITDGSSIDSLIKDLNSHPDVVYAEPNYVVKLTDIDSSQGTGQAQIMSAGDMEMMSSPTYSQDSANTQVATAWGDLASNSNRPIVAVVDTGVDYTHYVFTQTGAIWNNANEIANNGIDDDANGFIDDVRGWNFAYGTNNPMDDNGHGTHVSGIVIGTGQNILLAQGSLTTSVIRIMPLKFMDSTGSGTTANAVSAIDYAISNGAKVINNSWGGTGYSQALHDALTSAYDNGLFIATAAGNYTSNDDTSLLYPASLPIPGQVTVAATDNSDNLASFSSWGASTVQVAAPGVSVLSTYPNNQFAYLSGTSMASPFVAGLGALVLHQAPQLSGYQVRQILLESVNVISSLNGYVSSSGRVNAASSVINATSNISTQSSEPVYVAVAPAGASSGTTTTTTSGCGAISSGALAFGQGPSNGASPPVAVLIIGFLFLPLAVWFMVRTQLKKGYRRQHDRFVLNSEVRLKVDGRELVGRLSTIGLGGVSFNADALLAKGGVITLQIQAPDGGEQIQVAGRIVWSEQETSYGVQFGPVADSISDRILKWTSSLIKT